MKYQFYNTIFIIIFAVLMIDLSFYLTKAIISSDLPVWFKKFYLDEAK